MNPMPLQETLLAFSQKRVNANQVMRALCEHEGWFAPLGYAYHALQTNVFGNVTAWGNDSHIPADKLHLFSDAAHAHAAGAQVQIGPYASPLSGAALFAFLPAGLKELQVNPASAMEQRWFMGESALPLGALWGKAILLEQMLARTREGNLMEALFDFPAWSMFSMPNGAIATATNTGGLRNPGMIFTAPDCVDAAVEQLGAQASQLRRVTMSGTELFGAASRMGVDGFLVNPFGPGTQTVLSTQVIQAIGQALESRNELARLDAENKRLAEGS